MEQLAAVEQLAQDSEERELIDAGTGEVEWILRRPSRPGDPPAPKPKKAAGARFGEGYITLFQRGLRTLITDSRLTSTQLRVLIAYWMRSNHEERSWPVDHSAVARQLHLSVSTVASATSSLVAAGYLNRPRRGWLAHNPTLSWRGPAVVRQELLAELTADRSQTE